MHPRTHAVDVEGIGRFTFHKRRISDQVRIEAEANRMMGGASDDGALYNVAIAASTLRQLVAEAPEGWDVDDIDPLDGDEVEAKLWSVYRSLRAAEETFRRKD